MKANSLETLGMTATWFRFFPVMPSWKDGELRIIWSIYIYITWIEHDCHPFSMFLSTTTSLTCLSPDRTINVNFAELKGTPQLQRKLPDWMRERRGSPCLIPTPQCMFVLLVLLCYIFIFYYLLKHDCTHLLVLKICTVYVHIRGRLILELSSYVLEFPNDGDRTVSESDWLFNHQSRVYC